MEQQKEAQKFRTEENVPLADPVLGKVSGGSGEGGAYAINSDECIGCMACKLDCRMDAIEDELVDGYKICKINQKICVGCGVCESRCPVGAIYRR